MLESVPIQELMVGLFGSRVWHCWGETEEAGQITYMCELLAGCLIKHRHDQHPSTSWTFRSS